MKKWLLSLQNKLEKHAIGSHKDLRVFMSAEPAGIPSAHIIPQGILENSIKITNEPPTGIQANVHKALDNFNQVSMMYTFTFIDYSVHYSQDCMFSYTFICDSS